MSRKIENHCVNCGLPCLGRVCPNNRVQVYYCDDCESEEVIYHFDGDDLCENCTKKRITTTLDNWSLPELAEILGISLTEID